MFEKLKKIFSEKDEKKKTENLVAFLIILVITLIIMNNILSKDKEKNLVSNSTGIELVNKDTNETVEVSSIQDGDLKEELENILSKINGVGQVEVLLTYSETSSISPLYNESTSSSTSTEADGTTTETKTESKDVFTDSSNEAVIEKRIMPKLEGAIIIAEGARKYRGKS